MIRRWILWLLIIAFVWVVVSRFTEIEKLARILAQGVWIWVLIAASLQVTYYLVNAWLYQSAFDTVEVRSNILDLFPLIFSALFISVAAPIGGVTGTTVYIENSIRNNESGPRTAVGALLVIILEFSAFLLILFLGLAYLFIRNNIQTYEIIGAVFMILLFLALSSLLLIGLWNPETLLKILLGFQRVFNAIARRLKRPHPIQDAWAQETSDELTEAVIAITANPGKLARSLGIALLVHIVRISILGCVFVAFNQPTKLGVLVAGYAMGLLFWIISITPQGIGVVEGVMALVFTSIGVPAERGTIISLAFRGLSFWLPLAVGFFLVRRIKTFKTNEPTTSESWSVRTAAVLTSLMGMINVLSAITPSLHSRMVILERFLPFYIQRGGRLTAALTGFALLLLANSLWRRKRVAWLLTLIVLAIYTISHLLKGIDYEVSFLAICLMIWIAFLRPHFHARSDPPSVQQGLTILGTAMGFTIAYGVIGFYILDSHYKVNFNLVSALRQTIVMFTEFYDPGLVPVTQHGRFFADSIYIVGAVTIGYALIMMVRPVLMHSPATPDQRQQAAGIVETYGCSSIARFTLFND